MINLKVEGNFNKSLIRTLLELDMTVERVEFMDEGRLDALTKRMLQLRDEISWLDDGQAGTDVPESCRYFGKHFEIGRHV